MIHDSSLNKKHDCNDVIINCINVSCANNMQNPTLGFASFAMSTTYCNDHNWGDSSYDLENLFKPHDEYVCNNIESGFGRVSTLGNNDPTTLEIDQSYDFFNKSGLGEVMTLFYVNPAILEECQLCIMWIMKRIRYVIAILLNLDMIPHVIIMREENMVVEIFMSLN